METLTLFLTEWDLRGDYIDSYDCPIARALKRMFPNAESISGGPIHAVIDGVTWVIDFYDESAVISKVATIGMPIKLTKKLWQWQTI